jgi:hypothetical protein
MGAVTEAVVCSFLVVKLFGYQPNGYARPCTVCKTALQEENNGFSLTIVSV